jgi:hypothetical protein
LSSVLNLERPFLCRFSDAGKRRLPRAPAAGV